MEIVSTLSNQELIRELTPKELQLGRNILRTNLGFQKGESILLVTDVLMLEREAAVWFESAKTLTDQVQLIVLDGMTHSGEEPPQTVIDACAIADITMLHTSFSLTHTMAGKTVSRSNHRGASLPTVDYEMMMRTLTIDYQPIHDLGEKLKKALINQKNLEITSEAGTSLTTKIRSGQVFNDGGIITTGHVGNLPAGEVFFAPIEGTTNGTWVVNGSMADVELDEPIFIHIQHGYAVEFRGGKAAMQLEKKLRSIDPEALNIAEIGIGTNPSTNPHGELIEAEKAYATSHLALGNNSSMGGKVNVPIHLDGVTLSPEIKVDEKTIALNGKFLL